ncbi:MAG: aconitase family protein [Coleofasciculus sp. A1-SPW-01]
MLRRYDVHGCRGMIIEYYGPGLAQLSAMDRHVIANMGTEMGATTTVFPSDVEIKRFLEAQGRGQDWVELVADEDAEYDVYDMINLSELVPLIACPSSPGNVVPVTEVQGRPVNQVVIGSSANPGLRDFWIVSQIVKGKVVHDRVSFDVNPTSRQVIENLAAPPEDGRTVELEKGPNIKSFPEFAALSNSISVPVLLKVEDNISTDEILPAGARVLPYQRRG